MSALAFLMRNPVTAIVLTIAAYAVALALHRRWRWVPPLVAACIPLMALLVVAHVPFAEYNRGGALLSWWLGPATVGLAVPMFRHGRALRSSLGRLALMVLAGSVVGMASAWLTASLLGAPHAVAMAAVPKSVTTPIAVEVSRELGGVPEITIALVLLAGILGASFGVPILRLAGVRDDRAIGVAIGASSHGVGTASLVRRSEMQASVSSWAMAASGVFTSLLAALLKLLMH